MKVESRGEPLLRLITRTLYLAFGLVVLLWFLFQIRRVLLLFFLALVAALVLNVPVTSLERRGLARGMATAVVFLALAAILGLVGWFVVPRLLHEVPQLVDQIPALMADMANRAGRTFGVSSPITQQLTEVTRWMLGFVDDLWRYAGSLVTAVILTIVLTAMTLFLVSNPRPLLRGYIRVMPPHLRAPAARAFARGSEMVVGWVIANLVTGVIDATLTFLFLSWVGVHGVVVWTVLALLTSVLPAVGFYLEAIPPTLMAISISPLTALGVLVFFWVMSEFLGDFVAPRIWARTMRLHPVYLLFMVLASAASFGVAGVLIAVPLGGFLKAYFDEFYLLRQPPDERLEEHVDRILARLVKRDVSG